MDVSHLGVGDTRVDVVLWRGARPFHRRMQAGRLRHEEAPRQSFDEAAAGNHSFLSGGVNAKDSGVIASLSRMLRSCIT